jgi:outer membrane protein assembly factor BamB
MTAYDLEKGEVKWKWTEDGASYASPTMMTIGTTKMVVVQTNSNIVGIDLQSGKTHWKTPFPLTGKGGGGGGGYNTCTPTVEGDTITFSGSGRGMKAFKIEKKGDSFTPKEVWSNKENSTGYNSPVIKKGHIFGLASNDTLFCVNAETGKTAWTHTLQGRRGYGTVVDAGSVLMAMTPTSGLVVFEPSEKEYTELASYKTVGANVHAYPIVTGNRIYIKDQNSVILYTVGE